LDSRKAKKVDTLTDSSDKGGDAKVVANLIQDEIDARAHKLGLRAIAIYEAAKGLIVLVSGSGLLLLVHRDAQAIAERLVAHVHLNPASRYPRIFVQIATGASPFRLRLLALGALIYALLRFAEAVGLWHARRWAEWFAVATGLLYVPFEVAALIRRPSIEVMFALLTSLGIVAYLAMRLRNSRRKECE
jgi:uncharacterized membrane protein (DUF2068 family)